jgi:RimJ/RimL family protein N-acetyltransferase
MQNAILRKVTSADRDMLFEWANDPVTRANAFNTDTIPYDVHKEWFDKKINAANIVFYIYAEKIGDKETCIGQIRVDIEDVYALINYSIAPLFRNKGHGSNMVKLMEKHIKSNYSTVELLVAKVKYQNEASQHIFRKLCYEENHKQDFICFSKRI